MKRRDFLKSSIYLSGGLFGAQPFSASCSGLPEIQKSKIIISRDTNLHTNSTLIDSSRLEKILDNGMLSFFNVDKPVQAWKKLVKPDEVIGLKVNCLSGLGSTYPDLVYLIAERLQEAGIRPEDIIIWDRQNSDLEDGKFKIRDRGKGIRCIGNDILGFEGDFETFGKSASLVCKTLTRLCDGIINLPVLRDHGIAGVTMALKNMFGAIHNPNKFHLNAGDPYIADVFSYPSIKNKVRLTICDATTAQYEGGPSFMPHWRWAYNGLIFGTDPVALDYTGWQIIEEERTKRGLKPLKKIGREPSYIATAADKDHLLGTNDPNKIFLKEI